MSISIDRAHLHFVGKVDGIDLRQPLSKAEAIQLDRALDKFGVLIFRNQNISDEQQILFTKNFGNIELAIGGNVT